jgi:pimeloyl-ACP methyl ester carboxylesterase
MVRSLLSARCVALTAAAAAVAATLTAGPAAAGRSGDVGDISWRPCPEQPAVSCGTLTLPVDWSNPAGATFELAVSRRPAADPARRVGALFVNPGGPGGSGIDFTFAAASVFRPELLQRFDIIGVDPRGVARSHPVVCSAEVLSRPGDTPLPRSQTEYAGLVAFNRQLAADCRSHTGPLYDHVDSVSVARDLDAVRAALGEQTLNWYGASYGTLIGQMYAELFPGRIRAMVNDGNMDHSLGTSAFQLTEASFVEDSYAEFVAWCHRSTNCAVHGQDVRAVYAQLLAEADAGTLVDPADSHRVSPWELLDITQFFFGRPRWVELGDLIESLASGVASAGADSARATFTAERSVKVHQTAATAGKTRLVEDVRPQFCQDWSLPIRDFAELDRLWTASNRVAPSMRTSVLAWISTMQCIGWPGRVNNPQHRLDVEGAPTILMLNGKHDPATGYAWALNVAAQLRDQAVLVTYEGAGHTAYRRNACTRAAADRYLLEQTVPPSGTVCEASDPALARTTGQPETGWLSPHRDHRCRPVATATGPDCADPDCFSVRRSGQTVPM